MTSHYGFNSLFLLKSITRYHYCPLSYRWQCPLAIWSESCVLIGYPAHLVRSRLLTLIPREKENCSRWTYKKVRIFLTVCAMGSLKALKIVKLRKHNQYPTILTSRLVDNAYLLTTMTNHALTATYLQNKLKYSYEEPAWSLMEFCKRKSKLTSQQSNNGNHKYNSWCRTLYGNNKRVCFPNMSKSEVQNSNA